MPLYLKNGAILVSRGKLAQSCDCCVPAGCCGKGESLSSAIGHVPYVITLDLTAGFSDAGPLFSPGNPAWSPATYTPPTSVYENLGTWTYKTNVVNSETKYCLNGFNLVKFVDDDGTTYTSEYPVSSSIQLYKPATTNECTLQVSMDADPGGAPVFPSGWPASQYYGPFFSTKFSLTKTTYNVTNYAWYFYSFGTGFPPPSYPVLPLEQYFLTYEESLLYPNVYYYPGQPYLQAMWLAQRMKYVFTLTISEA